MRTLTLVFLLLTILGGMCTKTQYQPKLIPGLTTKDKLKTSHLGSALLNMISLGNTVQADFDDLYNALNLLKESLTAKKNEEIADFKADGEAHRLASSRLNRLIDTYDNQAITFQDELDVLLAEGQSLASNLANQQTQLSTAQQSLENENAIIEKIAEDLAKQTEDYEGAIRLLGEALIKLNEARAAGGNIFGSFLETNKQTFQDLQQRIATTLVSLKAKSVITKPINQFFVQLTNSQPSSATLGRAIEALDNLRTYYQEGLAALQKNSEEATQQHQALVVQIQVQIGELQNVIIPKTESDIESNQEAQGIRVTQVTEAQRNSRIESGNLENENQSWAQRVEQHELLMPQYSEEYAIVEQAEILLRQQE